MSQLSSGIGTSTSTAAARSNVNQLSSSSPRDFTLNPGTRAYLLAATARSTRASYGSASKSFADYCVGIEPLDYSITEGRVADWIVSLADGGQHAGSTITAYLSAISTEWVNRTAGEVNRGPNPTSAEWVRRVLQGIQNELAAIDQKHRQERYVEPLLMATLKRIRNQFTVEGKFVDKLELSIFAAATLGVAALLRPNALCGSQHYKERGVKAEHIRFFTAGRSPMSRTSTETPDHFTLFVPIDKTDQGRKGNERTISAPTAVEPMWLLWCQSEPEGTLFMNKKGKPMRCETITSRIKVALRIAGYAHVDSFSGRSFRRGGASSLAEAGVHGDPLARAGAWAANSHVPQRYIGAEQHRQQRLDTSRLMERI